MAHRMLALFLSVIVCVGLAGCGGGGGGGGPTTGSPVITPGTYTGQEVWTSGSLSGQSFSLVAIAASGNRLAAAGNPGPDGLYTGFAVGVTPDSSGRFTFSVAELNLGSVIFPAATVSGRNVPTAIPQVTGTMTQQLGVGSCRWSLTLQPGANNPFAGWYVGSMSGAVISPITGAIGPNGTSIAVQGGQGRWAACSIGTTNATTGVMAFTHTNPGVTVTGTAHSDATASGTYNFTGTGSGAWSATRQ